MTSSKPTSNSMSRLSLWAVGYALRRWPALVAVAATTLVKIGLDVLRPWPLKVLIDHSLGDAPVPPALAQVLEVLPGAATAEGLLTWCVAATLVLFLIAWAVSLAAAYANIGLAQRMTYDLAADLFGHFQRLSLRFHGRRPIGDSIRRVTTDCGCVATIVRDGLLPVLTSVLTLAAMFAILWQLDPLLTLLSLAVVPFLVITFRLYARPMLEHSYAQQEAEGKLYNVVEQTMSAIPVVQAFGREEDADQRFRGSIQAVLNALVSTTNVQLKFKILCGLITALGTAGILWLGATHVQDGRLTVGGILVFLAYLASFYKPLESVMYSGTTIQGAAGSARRVLGVLEADPEVADRPGALPLPLVTGQVRLENVTFGYEPGRPVLGDVSLEVLPGQTVALVGATGAGKTTLAGLVLRFFDPWQGRVLIDGRDVRDVQLKSLRDQVGLVLQESFLFPMTIAENIAYGQPGASRDDIEAAARAASIHEFITQLPEGYDTVVGERGATLSGGERQRLAIARALLKNAPILILDEPTSALDAHTERLFLEALGKLVRGRTTLVIAHRFSTVRHADKIVVLKHGRIVEVGSHDELMARQGLYAGLYELQFAAATPDVMQQSLFEGSTGDRNL